MVSINILLSGAAVTLVGMSQTTMLFQHFLSALAVLAGVTVIASLVITRFILHVVIRH